MVTGDGARIPESCLRPISFLDGCQITIRCGDRNIGFLVPSQRLDRVESCGFSGWKIAKYDTRQKSTRERNHYR
jgi:hypothetical protein